MANNVGTYLQTKRAAWFAGTTHPTVPTSFYFALWTVAPAKDGTGGTEVTGGSYARIAVSSTGGFITPTGASPAQTSNTNAITFATATANWGTVLAVSMHDALAGNLLYTNTLTASIAVNSGGTFSFAIAALVIQED